MRFLVVFGGRSASETFMASSNTKVLIIFVDRSNCSALVALQTKQKATWCVNTMHYAATIQGKEDEFWFVVGDFL